MGINRSDRFMTNDDDLAVKTNETKNIMGDNKKKLEDYTGDGLRSDRFLSGIGSNRNLAVLGIPIDSSEADASERF